MSRKIKIITDNRVPVGKLYVVSPDAGRVLLDATLAGDGLLALALMTMGRRHVTLALNAEDEDRLREIHDAINQIGAVAT